MSEAYKDGIEAAYRIGKYKNYTDVPKNPYPSNSKEENDWDEGFGDGTEDFIGIMENNPIFYKKLMSKGDKNGKS